MALRIAQEVGPPEEGWWTWSVWIDGPAAELDQVTRVVYVLHPTFPNPVRTVTDRSSRFRLDASGWGEFRLYATVALADGTEKRLEHDLVLRSADGSRAPNKGGPSAAPPTAQPPAQGMRNEAAPAPRPSRWMQQVGGTLAGVTLLALYLLFVSWPDGSGRIRVLGDAWVIHAGRSVRLILVVLFAGAVGGALSSLLVLVNAVGNVRYLEASWLPWFLLRPPVGALFGVIVYVVLGLVLLSSSASAGDVSTVGVAVIGLLAGVYSKRATSRVRDGIDRFRRPPDRLDPERLNAPRSGPAANTAD